MSNFKKSIGFALDGIVSCFKNERHFKVHTVSALLVIAAGIFFHLNTLEWLITIGCISSVMAAELINTAIEELCNILHQEKHPRIKIVKDMAAGAVLIVAITAAITAAIIFIPKIFFLFTKMYAS